MPKLELKQVQRDLEKGVIWPVYWIHGPERMKAREILRRIRRTVLDLPEASGAEDAVDAFREERIDATEVSTSEVLDRAKTLSWGGGPKLVIVREAHSLDEPEILSELLGPVKKREELDAVCVFLSKDLDGRKKFSKVLVEKACVIPCEEVSEADREAWIGYLASRRKLDLPVEAQSRLRAVDPWSLDTVDSELEKWELALAAGSTPREALEILAGGLSEKSEDFIDAFLRKDKARASRLVEGFASQPEVALPLMGLLAWNVRHLALAVSDRENGTRAFNVAPFLAGRFHAWRERWTLGQVVELQSMLARMDFHTKQTPRLPLGLWHELVIRFC